jgi:hypothetical protein
LVKSGAEGDCGLKIALRVGNFRRGAAREQARRYPDSSSDEECVMAIDPEELEEIPPQGHVRVLYTGPVAPHWEIHRVFGDMRAIDDFRQRAMARLQLLPVYDPQFRRNRERVARDAEREHLILEWDLGDEPE